jgi:two-component sensor histidine kinase
LQCIEDELDRQRETEAKLRESSLRESDLLRQKEELVLQKDILHNEVRTSDFERAAVITSLLALQSRTTRNSEVAAQLTIAASRVATLGRVHRHLHL